MRIGLVVINLIVVLLMAGCGENKSVSYFKKHPDELFSSAMKCSTLADKDVLQNKTCLTIAAIEKPACESELKLMGRISTPQGWVYNCDDPYYLIARPVIEAKMKAVLAGQPDPAEEYLKKHSDKQ